MEMKQRYSSFEGESTTNSILEARAKTDHLMRAASSGTEETNAYSVQNKRVLDTLRLLNAVKKKKRNQNQSRTMVVSSRSSGDAV
jgi:hypothetical protein